MSEGGCTLSWTFKVIKRAEDLLAVQKTSNLNKNGVQTSCFLSGVNLQHPHIKKKKHTII